MNKLKKWGIYLSLIIIMIGIPLLFSHPSDAVSSRNQNMIELGIIDEVVPAEELGLEHLLRHPPQFAQNRSRLMEALDTAQEEVVQDTRNISRAIELQTDRPVSVGELLNDRRDGRLRGDLDAIGVVSPSGTALPILNTELRDMFANEEAGGGTLTIASFDENSEKLVADASGSWLEARRVPVFDLIVLQRQTGRVFLVPDVLGDAFCRDALNNVLRSNGRLRRNTVDLRRLRT